MATVTAIANGAWTANAATVWDTGVVPGAGDTVDLAAKTVSLDMAATPALSVLKATGAGQLTVNLSVGNFAINATSIQAGTKAGALIAVTGATNTLTITGAVVGGSSDYSYGVDNGGTGTVIINGNVTGGSGSDSHGAYNTSTGVLTINGIILAANGSNSCGVKNYTTGTINITGNITGGSGSLAYGMLNLAAGPVNVTNSIITGGSGNLDHGFYNYGAGAVTLTNVNLVNSTNAVAYAGKPPGTITNTAVNYMQWGSVKYPLQLLDHQVLAGVAHGDITGNRVDCPVAKAVSTSGNYGDPASPLVGTYHEPEASEVWHTAVFGANSEVNGTKVASSIANCEAGNIKSGVVIDDVTGTLASVNPLKGLV